MRTQSFVVDYFKHNDKQYMFAYTSTSTKILTKNTLFVPLSSNGIFTFLTNDGFTNFMRRAPHYLKYFERFAGAGHIIPDDDSSAIFTPRDILRENTKQTHFDNYTMREAASTSSATLPPMHH